MASDKVLKYLTDKYGEYNYKIRLTDLTDDDVRKICAIMKGMRP